MKESSLSISEVSSTMLITLYARARESQSKNPVITDSKAIEMIGIIKKEIAGSDNPIHRKIVNDRYNSKLAVTMALRCRRFDRYVVDFLSEHPEGTIINLGCGLDTRFYRIDNGYLNWFDIDFPEVIGLRKRFMEENSRHFFLGSSVTDPGWIKKVKTGGPYLVLAEGLFMYLSEKDVKELFERIQKELGQAEIVCEVSNLFWVKKMNSKWMQRKFKRQLGMTGGAIFSFGVPDSRYFERWSSNYQFLDDWTYFDDNEKKLGWFNLFSSIELLRKVQWTIHYRLG